AGAGRGRQHRRWRDRAADRGQTGDGHRVARTAGVGRHFMYVDVEALPRGHVEAIACGRVRAETRVSDIVGADVGRVEADQVGAAKDEVGAGAGGVQVYRDAERAPGVVDVGTVQVVVARGGVEHRAGVGRA